MKSVLNKRLQGILVAVLVALVAGAAGATTATASPAATDGVTISAVATTSALNARQKRAMRVSVIRCKRAGKARTRRAKRRLMQRRRACVVRVKRKFKRIAIRNRGRQGETKVVDVMDDYYDPAQVNLKAGDKIKWDWRFSTNSMGHDVALDQGPKGVKLSDIQSRIMYGPDDTFTRQFKRPGNYSLHCSLHAFMNMNVRVTR